MPDVVCNNAAISACDKGTQWEMALGLLWVMIHQLLTLNVLSYTAAISACEKAAHWEGAIVFLLVMAHL